MLVYELFFIFSSDELLHLDKNGFGKLLNKSVNVRAKREMFCKPHPDTLSPDNSTLKLVGMTLDAYTAKFNNVSKLEEGDSQMIMDLHPHQELMQTILTQNSSSDDDNWVVRTLKLTLIDNVASAHHFERSIRLLHYLQN